MRVSFVALSVAFLTVVSAVAIPRGYGDSDVRLQRRTSRFFGPGSSGSDTSSSEHHTGSTHSGSPPQGGNLSPPHSIGHPPSFSSGSSDHRPKPARITFSDSARKQLDGLNLHGKERKKVKTEHVNRIKQEMKKNGATHAQIHYLSHSEGSKDPNIHMTAQFQKQHPTANHMEQIKSNWHSSEGAEATPNHHVYAHMDDKTKGKEAIAQHQPHYAAAVAKKQGTSDPKY